MTGDATDWYEHYKCQGHKSAAIGAAERSDTLPLDCDDLPDGAEPFTDLGNAHRLAQLFGADLRHTAAHGWLAYDGRRWERDATGAAARAAHATARELSRYAGHLLMGLPSGFREAGELSDADRAAVRRAQQYLTWARKSQDGRRLTAMVQIASALEGIACRADVFDRAPMLFNVLNGTIDLETGKLRPHDRADLITKIARVTFDRRAEAPRWKAFLERMLPDQDVREFLKRWIGYCLTGSVAEQALLINHGQTGDNGKTTFQNVTLDLLGDYATQAAPDLLLSKKGEAHPTEQADLEGRRLAICTEVEQGREFATATLKRLTGGDRIKARFMRQDFFTIDPTHKLMIACNHKPRVRGADHAMWRRFLLCPWTVRIPKGEKDTTLPAKLHAELSGILNWAIAGCLAWRRDGLRVPDAVRLATQKYRDDSDQLGRFLRACGDPATPADACIEATALFHAYARWCEQEGEIAWKQRTFTLALEERATELKITKGKDDRTRRSIWTGIALLPEAEK